MNYISKLTKHTKIIPKIFKILKSNLYTNTIYRKINLPSYIGIGNIYQKRYFRSTNINLEEKRDYYEVLGLKKDATKQEIKKKYFELAKKYHPDKNPNDKDAKKKFIEVTAAYEVLSDDNKRKMYDEFGHQGVDPNMGGFNGFNGMSAEDIFSQFSSMFGGGGSGGGMGGDFGSDFFGFGQKPTKSGPIRGDDIEYNIRLNFMDGIKGCERDVSLTRQCTCSECNGTGAKPGSSPISCPKCHGQGYEEVATGFFSMRSTCRKCSGEGKINGNPCKKCAGEGNIRESKKITVNIPPGVDNNDTIRVPNQGNAGKNGGKPGNLYLRISIQPDSFFQRQGHDIHTIIPITLSQAILGGKMSIPSVDGEVDINVPVGTNPGDTMNIKGKGVTKSNGVLRGNQVVHFDVKIPKKLTPKQKELMEEFSKEEKVEQSSGKFSILTDVINRIKSCLDGKNK